MNVLPRRADAIALTVRTAAPMAAVGPSFEIAQWNEGAEELLGLAGRDVLGKSCFEVLRCPLSARRLCRGGGSRAGLEEGAPPFDLEACGGLAEPVRVRVTTLLVPSGDGASLRVHLFHDLSRQRRLEDLLREVLTAASRASEPFAGPGGRVASRPPAGRITGREHQVVRLLAQGGSTAEIAARLGIAPRTARNHIQNLLCKLRVHSRLEAVAHASARGLV